MDHPGDHADSTYEVYAPTSGSQQFWWLADSVPFGRLLVIGVLATGLVGIGFGLGRLGQKVVVQTINVPILAPRDEPLPTASLSSSKGVVLDASLDNPSQPLFAGPAYAEFQPRLPWEEAPTYLDPAQLAVDSFNRQVSASNMRSMEAYVRRLQRSESRVQRPASEVYYVTRRTPAYRRQAQLGDRPLRYLQPGTPLQLKRTQSRWAEVEGPGGQELWVKVSTLSTDKTHRST
jgi:hypothetical protein